MLFAQHSEVSRLEGKKTNQKGILFKLHLNRKPYKVTLGSLAKHKEVENGSTWLLGGRGFGD